MLRSLRAGLFTKAAVYKFRQSSNSLIGVITIAATHTPWTLRYDNNADGIDDSTSGYGLSLSGKFVFDNKDDFRWMVNTGSGMGRYMGLNIANGAVLDADGNLHAFASTSAFDSPSVREGNTNTSADQ